MHDTSQPHQADPAQTGSLTRRKATKIHFWNLHHLPSTGCTHDFTAHSITEQTTVFIPQRLSYRQNNKHNNRPVLEQTGTIFLGQSRAMSPQNMTSNYFIGANVVVSSSKPCWIKQLDPCCPENRQNLPKICMEESEQTNASLNRASKDTKQVSLNNVFS